MSVCAADDCFPLVRYCERDTMTEQLVHSGAWLAMTAVVVLAAVCGVFYELGQLAEWTTPGPAFSKNRMIVIAWSCTSVLAPACFLMLRHSPITVVMDIAHVAADQGMILLALTLHVDHKHWMVSAHRAWAGALFIAIPLLGVATGLSLLDPRWLFACVQWGGAVGDVAMGAVVLAHGDSRNMSTEMFKHAVIWHSLYVSLVFLEPWLGAGGRALSYAACCAGGVLAMRAARHMA
jgi:hypothetical protein